LATTEFSSSLDFRQRRIQTTQARFPKLKAEVTRLHSYEVPEIIALPITAGATDYLTWISESVNLARRPNK
jgi:periplasmic divalent cation tolerance protein